MAFTNEQLHHVANRACSSVQQDSYLDEAVKQNFYKTVTELVDYLAANTIQLPVIKPTNPREASYYDAFQELLSTIEKPDAQDTLLLKALASSPMFITSLLQKIANTIEAKQDDTLLIKAVEILKQFGLTDEHVLQSLAGIGTHTVGSSYYVFFYHKPTILVDAAGKYVASLFKEYEARIIQYFITDHESADWSTRLVGYLARNTPYDLSGFLSYRKHNTQYVSFENAVTIATYRAEQHEELLKQAYSDGNVYVTNPQLKYFILRGLANTLPEKYRKRQLYEAREYFAQLNERIQQSSGSYWGYREPSYWVEDEKGNRTQQKVSSAMLDDIFTQDPANARQIAWDLLTYVPVRYIAHEVFQVIEKHLGEASVDVLAQGLLTDKGDGSTLKALLEVMSKYDSSQQHLDKVWNITKDKVKSVRMIIATELAKLGDAALPKAEELLRAKSADVRLTVAILLARIKSERAGKILLETVNSEKNDDARDVMVESLGEKRYQGMSPQQLADMIAAARTRGKLDAPLTDWLAVANLPPLHWKTGTVLTTDETLFLLYRMSRAKEIRSDVEARPLLQLIDRKSSGDFARKLFKLFIDNGGDAKQKYCLTLAGLLGDDSMVDGLRSQINKWVESARGKMAEYGVVALALLGTNKALRTVEFFSRKYKNKYSNIGAAALEALQIAAEELGMDMNELADSIIPDFGFEDMYKVFKVGDEEFRLFVNKDFKLVFLNEDGKLLKSAPKNTEKHLLDEFKEIGKEIKDVVKSQSSRMELYLVIQRRWQPDNWQKFFVGNPIMFVYATHLLWGIFDASGQLESCFYCAEDTTLLSLDDDEIALPAERLVGMVHPLSLSAEQQQAWVQKFDEVGITQLFPQLHRPVVALKSTEKDLTTIKEFADKKGGAAQVKGAFKRLGWVTWELGDHGDVYSYAKLFDELGVQAIITTSGGLFMGYTEEGWPAEFGDVFFCTTSDKKYGEAHLPLGQVPAIVYSEVISELRQVVPKEEVSPS